MRTVRSNTFGVAFFLKKQKTTKTGKCPIYVRITVNGKRIELSLKRSIEEENWHPQKGMARGSKLEIANLNTYLEEYRAGIVSSYQELVIQKKLITAELLKEKFRGKDESKATLCSLMEYHNKDLNDTLKWGTMKNYMTTQKYIQNFLKKKYHTSDKYLSELNYRFITDFEYYLRTYKNESGEIALANNGVMKHLERFRKMMSLAIRLEWVDKNPFVAYQLKFEKVERDYLTREELLRIEQKNFSLPRLKIVQDLFIFSCYSGLSYIDLANLTPDNVVIGHDAEPWLVTERQKTNNPVKFPLLPKALLILEKYKDHPKAVNEGKLLPTFSNQKLNSYLKEIADLCDITKPLTFHIARHTFATTITLSNGVPIESVSKMLGHTKLTTTQIYAKVIDRKMSEDVSRLKQKLLADG